jgi:hypothetical protein
MRVIKCRLLRKIIYGQAPENRYNQPEHPNTQEFSPHTVPVCIHSLFNGSYCGYMQCFCQRLS